MLQLDPQPLAIELIVLQALQKVIQLKIFLIRNIFFYPISHEELEPLVLLLSFIFDILSFLNILRNFMGLLLYIFIVTSQFRDFYLPELLLDCVVQLVFIFFLFFSMDLVSKCVIFKYLLYFFIPEFFELPFNI